MDKQLNFIIKSKYELIILSNKHFSYDKLTKLIGSGQVNYVNNNIIYIDAPNGFLHTWYMYLHKKIRCTFFNNDIIVNYIEKACDLYLYDMIIELIPQPFTHKFYNLFDIFFKRLTDIKYNSQLKKINSSFADKIKYTLRLKFLTKYPNYNYITKYIRLYEMNNNFIIFLLYNCHTFDINIDKYIIELLVTRICAVCELSTDIIDICVKLLNIKYLRSMVELFIEKKNIFILRYLLHNYDKLFLKILNMKVPLLQTICSNYLKDLTLEILNVYGSKVRQYNFRLSVKDDNDTTLTIAIKNNYIDVIKKVLDIKNYGKYRSKLYIMNMKNVKLDVIIEQMIGLKIN